MTQPADDTFDFAAMLEASFEEMEEVRRGDILEGVILAIDDQGMIIDVGLKRDGVISRSEAEEILVEDDYRVGGRVLVMVIDPEDRDGNLSVSIKQARASKDWASALKLMENDELYLGDVIAANKGGLIVPFGELRGFVPASHIADMPRGLDDEERIAFLRDFVGRQLSLKIIEVNARRRRLVLSQRQAQRQRRERAKERLIEQLQEGDIVKGRVRSLRDFGAFVDLGGADGLIHISELAWRRVRHPSEILSVGQEVEVFVLQIDEDGHRIGLSLKRLQENPWETIKANYALEQEVEGCVSRLVAYGAFIELDNGIEALLHLSEMGTPAPELPEELFAVGDRVRARIISLEPERQRMGLSISHIRTADGES